MAKLALRTKLIGVGAVLLCCVPAFYFGYTWLRVRHAMHRWHAVGGSVDADDIPWPRGISVGGTPGFGPSRDMDQVLAALDEMRQLPEVRRIHIHGLPLSTDQVRQIAAQWKGTSFHASEIAFDDSCLEALLQNPRLELILLNNCPVSTAELLRVQKFPKISIHMNRSDLSAEDATELKRVLDTRIKIYGLEEK